MQTHLKNELLNFISGKVQVRFGEIIQTIAGYLGYGSRTSAKTVDTKQIREQEEAKLESFITEHKLWARNIDFSQYVSEGSLNPFIIIGTFQPKIELQAKLF